MTCLARIAGFAVLAGLGPALASAAGGPERPPRLAGATRTYRLSVRYNAPQDWIHTLQPYREYFQGSNLGQKHSEYGRTYMFGVTYKY